MADYNSMASWLLQVDAIDCAWGGFAAAVERIEDVFDIYIKQSGFLEWPLEELPNGESYSILSVKPDKRKGAGRKATK